MKIVSWLLDDELHSYLLESNVDHTVLVELLQVKGASKIRVENVKACAQEQLDKLLNLI